MVATEKKKKKATALISDRYYFDQEAADRVCAFFPRFLSHVKGELGGQPYDPMPWIKERILRPVFGWKDKETGYRMIRTVYAQLPRKNDKTTCITGIGLYMLVGEDEPGAEIYNAAADREQARISFDIAKGMILHNERLQKALKIYRDSIVRESTLSTYKVISSDADTKHGYNSQCVICDELHAWPGRDLFDVLDTSTGSRRQPLTLMITTPGHDKRSVCYQKYLYAKKVQSGEIVDSTFLPIIFETDKESDPLSEETWKAANPGYGVTVKKEYIFTRAQRALAEPSYMNTFKRLHLGQWVDSAATWISKMHWDNCAGPVKKLEDFRGRDCFLFFDLASKDDMVALCMVFPDGDHVDVLMKYWVTEYRASERKKRNEVDYFVWIKQGHVEMIPGNSYDHQMVRSTIYEINKICNIRAVGYDEWNASQIALDLTGDGMEPNGWNPGNWKLWNAPTKTLERMVISGKINHMGHPVLAWNMENVVIRYKNGGLKTGDNDDNFKEDDYIRPDKAQSKDKIDGVIALVGALGEWMNYVPAQPKSHGLGL